MAWLALSVVTVAVAGLLLSLVAQTGFTPLAALPFWELWLLGSAMLGITLVLEGPMRRAMEKLIFPGAHLEGSVLADWRVRLEAADSWSELEAVAASLADPLSRPTSTEEGSSINSRGAATGREVEAATMDRRVNNSPPSAAPDKRIKFCLFTIEKG